MVSILAALAAVKAFIASLLAIGYWILLGAGIGFFSAVFRPLLGTLGAVILGGTVMAVAMLGGFFTDNSDELERLKEQNAALEAKQLELRLTSEALRHTLREMAKAEEHNEQVEEGLRTVIESLRDRPGCVVPREFTDGLKNLR